MSDIIPIQSLGRAPQVAAKRRARMPAGEAGGSGRREAAGAGPQGARGAGGGLPPPEPRAAYCLGSPTTGGGTKLPR